MILSRCTNPILPPVRCNNFGYRTIRHFMFFLLTALVITPTSILQAISKFLSHLKNILVLNLLFRLCSSVRRISADPTFLYFSFSMLHFILSFNMPFILFQFIFAILLVYLDVTLLFSFIKFETVGGRSCQVRCRRH